MRLKQHVPLDKVALGQVFSECFGFPCQSSFHQFLPEEIVPGTDWRLGGLQSSSGRYGEEKMVPLPDIKPRVSSLLLYRLSYPDSCL
jgi:hypothetical protein